MSPPRRVVPVRGLAQILTYRGNERESVPTHKCYLRVSFLELERARHAHEIKTGQSRIAVLLARCQEIEAEKTQILATIRAAMPALEREAGPQRPGSEPKGGGQQGGRRFRYAY